MSRSDALKKVVKENEVNKLSLILTFDPIALPTIAIAIVVALSRS